MNTISIHTHTQMEPIKQPARTYLFYHNGNEQKNNNKEINKINKYNLQDELKSLVKTFLVNKLWNM